jgi:hypothetical protein
MRERSITVRISPDLDRRISKVLDPTRDPYAPTLTRLVERGLELVLAELEKRKK